ncbi:hypothetical protein GCM10027280_02160 [Micromonospora polyrhachis]|uniref:Signal peptidase I n=1 Tax=Micromonospora polyrhachis TaxID=1282883 RepID=A0A7W7SNJ9_9ACTN|nr:signal peptidase I [Micromonospora polyrhachis]MBB4957492.1 signal peptidase I [Micromonospora polyrhachis]
MREVDESDDVEPVRRRARRPRRQLPLWQELPLLLIVAFGIAILIRTFLLQPFFIPSGSMEDTLLVGDRVLVNKIVYDVRDPRRGEVVVFRGTDRWVPQAASQPETGFFKRLGRTLGDLVGFGRPGEKDFIKRVIGVPGDRVACCDELGRVTVNDVPLDETYIPRNSPLEIPPNSQECRSRRFEEVVVPPGQLFVMGDHRLVSLDARCQGPIPIDNVIGRAIAVVWPYDRWTSLSVPPFFEDLPTVEAAPARPAVSTDGPQVPVGGPVSPVDRGASGGIAVVLPILGSMLIAARSRQPHRARHRRLHS